MKNLLFAISLCFVVTTNLLGQSVGKDTTLNSTPITSLKFSGYIHAQFQKADSAGIPSYAGGNFAAGVDNRFAIRRGRFKVDYQKQDKAGNVLNQAVVQIDFTQNGLVLRDAYVNTLLPNANWLGVKLGAMDKPFGYEIGYSSSTRETPERGRMSQILFPGEKDLGGQLYILPTKGSPFRFFKWELGWYNGTGVNAADFDSYKDFITHLSFFEKDVKKPLQLSGGLSYFNGGHRYGTKYIYSIQGTVHGPSWVIADSSTDNLNKQSKQVFYGVDAQASYKWSGGLSLFKAEFITGTTTGSSTGSATPKELVITDAYERNFEGMYVYLIHQFKNSKHTAVIKYDYYDPNTKVSNAEIGKDPAAKLNLGDIKFSTLGMGYIYKMDQNWSITAYYDKVWNQATQLSNYKTDIKDDVFTLKFAYRF